MHLCGTSKTVRAFRYALVSMFFATISHAELQKNNLGCNSVKKNGVYRTIQSAKLGCIEFNFNQKTRVVSLRTKNKNAKKLIVKKYDSFYSKEAEESFDYSPSLVGMSDSMGFIKNNTSIINGQEYLALLIYERSTGGNGGGHCGAGAEGYLIGYKLIKNGFKKTFTTLIDSCSKMMLNEFPNYPEGAVYIKDSYVHVDWSINEKISLDGGEGLIKMSNGDIQYIKQN